MGGTHWPWDSTGGYFKGRIFNKDAAYLTKANVED